MKTHKGTQIKLFEIYLEEEVHKRLTLTDYYLHHNSVVKNGDIIFAYI